MKISLVTSTLSRGGVGRNMTNLANEFVALGHNVTLFLTKIDPDLRLNELSSEVTIVRGRGSAKSSFLRVRRHYLDFEPEMVISGPSYINLLSILAAMSTPNRKHMCVVATYRSHRSTEIQNQRWAFKIIEFLFKWVYRQADYVVGVSEGVTDDLVASIGVSRDKAVTIYNPAYDKRIVDAIDTSGANHDWFLDGPRRDYKVVVAVGRLVPQKDYESLILAFNEAAKVRSLRLLILGEGVRREKLERLVAKLGLSDLVYFGGHVDNPLAYIKQADLFVLSSRWEGFANVIVEALSVGTYVVSTDCPSGPSEIICSSDVGLLVPVGDVFALAQSILQALEVSVKESVLIERATFFSANKSAKNYLNLASGDGRDRNK